MSARIKELEEQILYHNDLYTNSQPEISDKEYDDLLKELRQLDPANPVLLEVGATPSYGKKVKHDIVMGSLNKATYDDKGGLSELEKFYKDYPHPMRWSWKIDGLAAELFYKGGKLVEASTRGNGEIGSDVTDNVMAIDSIPKNIKPNSTMEKSEVRIRGEIYLPKSVFAAKFADTMANPRNAAAGILSQQDPTITGKAGLKFLAYKVLVNNNELINLDTEEIALKKTGLEYVELHDMDLRDPKLMEKLETEHLTKDYQIDGIVLSINDSAIRNSYGKVGKNPRAAIAWKFKPEQAETIIKEIEWSVGRTGIVTPVAIMDPVQLAGTTVTRSTLHNVAEMRRLNADIGAKVQLYKAGDIIPKIYKVITPAAKKTKYPTNCPVCGEKLIDDNIKFICTNVNCPAKLAANVLHYLRVLEIKDVGESIIDLMLEHNIVRSIPDLYLVTQDTLRALPRMGARSSQIVYEAIHSVNELPLAKFLTSLGIANLGETVGKQLAIRFKTLDAVLVANIPELTGIDGVGEKVAKDIYAGLKDNNVTISKLRKILKINDYVEIKGVFTGKNFCCTGTLSRPRKVIQDEIAKLGGNYGSISKGLNYLIIGEGAVPAKVEKAQKLGATVLVEEEFMKLCK